ncbi:MAG: RNA polymerase sigma factor [Kiritimatiellia bacterium]
MNHDLETLMDLHAPSLLRYAERLVRNPHSAQDVVQQVFVSYCRLPTDSLPAEGARKTWLYRAVHHQAVDLIRAEQRRKKLHEAHSSQQLPAQSAGDRGERKQLIREQLHRLKDQEKQVLLLRLEEGLSYREISEVTGLKEGHIGYLLHQAVRNLAEVFQTSRGSA